MYDRKVVRRRRAALAVFVVLSIAILTAYFGESSGGFFHTLQRGAQEAVAPIETGASRALKPVRDFFGWTGDTIDSRDAGLREIAAGRRGRVQVRRVEAPRCGRRPGGGTRAGGGGALRWTRRGTGASGAAADQRAGQ